MADAATIQEFLVKIGYRVDEGAERKFTDSLKSMHGLIEKIGLGIAGIAAGVITAVSNMAKETAKIHVATQLMGSGESVKNIEALSFALQKVANIDPGKTLSWITDLTYKLQNDPTLKEAIHAFLPTVDVNAPASVLGPQMAQAMNDMAKNEQKKFQVLLSNSVLSGLVPEDIRRAYNLPGIQDAQNQFNQQNKGIGLDPNKLGEQANQYRKALVDLANDWKSIWGKATEETVDPMTASLQRLHTWFDTHLPQIRAGLEKLGVEFKRLPDWMKDAIAAFGELGSNISGLNPVMATLATLLGVRILGGLTGIVFQLTRLAAITMPSWVLGILGLSGGVVGGALGALLLTGVENSREQENLRQGKPTGSMFPLFGKREGVKTELTPEEFRKAEEKNKTDMDWIKSIWRGFWDTIIPSAKAEELPDNIKNLSTATHDLTDKLGEILDKANASTWGQGIGQSVVAGLFGGSGGGGNLGPGHMSGVPLNDPKVTQAIKYFMSRGYTMPQAIGLVSNLWHESKLDPDAFNPAGGGQGAYGIAQWRGERQTNFQTLEGRPLRGSTLEQQLKYVADELATSHQKADAALRGTISFGDAVAAAYKYYEGAGNNDPTLPNRLATGRALMSNPNIVNSSADRTNTNNINQNITVNGARDAHDTARTLKEVQDKHWGDLTRQLAPNTY